MIFSMMVVCSESGPVLFQLGDTTHKRIAAYCFWRTCCSRSYSSKNMAMSLNRLGLPPAAVTGSTRPQKLKVEADRMPFKQTARLMLRGPWLISHSQPTLDGLIGSKEDPSRVHLCDEMGRGDQTTTAVFFL